MIKSLLESLIYLVLENKENIVSLTADKILDDNFVKALKSIDINNLLIKKFYLAKHSKYQKKEILLKIKSKQLKNSIELLEYVKTLRAKEKSEIKKRIKKLDNQPSTLEEIKRLNDRIRKQRQLTKDKLSNIGQITFKIDNDFKELINKKAKELNLTQSELIRCALTKFLNVTIHNQNI